MRGSIPAVAGGFVRSARTRRASFWEVISRIMDTSGKSVESETLKKLVIGWRVARDLKLEWFDYSGKRSHGDQPDHMLELIEPKSVATHTVIVAQSGSGKSFFLGRYLEEVLLKTQASVTIFDPNADFRLFNKSNFAVWKEHDTASKSVIDPGWKTSGDIKDPLPHEAKPEEFTVPWDAINIRVSGNRATSGSDGISNVEFHWSSLRPSFLKIGEDDLADPTGFVTLHEFISASDRLVALCRDSHTRKAGAGTNDEPRKNSPVQWIDELDQPGNSDTNHAQQLIATVRQDYGIIRDNVTEKVREAEAEFMEKFERARRVQNPERERYKRKYRTFEQRRRLCSDKAGMDSSFGLTGDVRVLDMPSFDDAEDRDTAILFLLESVWYKARQEWADGTLHEGANKQRKPHLIVIDEAHNLVPNEIPGSPLRSAIRDLIKTIAGEGRKYGLFLILVSQRPDKVDLQVLSECGNQAIMLMRTLSVLDDCRKLIGVVLDEKDSSTIMRDFRAGYARLSGAWSPLPRVIFGAARRTMTGGADLTDTWINVRPSVLRALEASQAAGSTQTNVSKGSVPGVKLVSPVVKDENV
jgi:Helicase HerA, central domain